MTTLHQAATMALDALETGYHQGTQDAITALRAALAAPQAEPVAWAKQKKKKLRITHMDMRGEEGWRPLVFGDAAVQSAAHAVPLTDEQLAKIAVEDEFLLYCDQDSFNEIARAIEQAHGIGGGGK